MTTRFNLYKHLETNLTAFVIEKLTKTSTDKIERRNNKKQTFHNAANQE